LLEMLEKTPDKRPGIAQVRQVLEEVRQTAQYMADWGNSEPIRITANNQPRILTPGPRVAETVLEGMGAPKPVRKSKTPMYAAAAGVVIAGAVIGIVA